MSTTSNQNRCTHADEVSLYVLGALPIPEAEQLEVHLASCEHCCEELNALRSVVAAFVTWPTPVHRPPTLSWGDLLERIAAEPLIEGVTPSRDAWIEPEWEDVAPGISCKLLSSDAQRDRVAMLVRLTPGTEYPPHTHAGTEELHLLDGELWIDEKKLHPGDYNRAVAGTADRRVWSETGCTCLLITSPSDVIS